MFQYALLSWQRFHTTGLLYSCPSKQYVLAILYVSSKAKSGRDCVIKSLPQFFPDFAIFKDFLRAGCLNFPIKILSGLFSCFLSPNSQLSSYQKGENILERKSQTPLRQNANRLYLYRMEILQSALSISHISYFSVPWIVSCGKGKPMPSLLKVAYTVRFIQKNTFQ